VKSSKQIPYILPLFVLAVSLGTLGRWQGALLAEDAVPPKLQSLVNTYCVSCHNQNKSEGDLRLDPISSERWSDYDLIDAIVTRIEDGEMPPEDAKKPLAESDRTALLSQLKPRIASLAATQLAGKYKKLTAQEYNNTLIDLFGEPLEKIQNLPFDSDNDLKKVGEHQLITSYAVMKYYDVAADYLERHIAVDPPKVNEVTLTQPDNPKEWIHTSRFNQSPLGPIVGTGNAPTFMLRSPVNSYADEGEYEITFEYRTFYLTDREKFDPEKEYKSEKPPRPPTLVLARQMNVVSEHERVGDRKLGDKQPYQVRIDQPIRVTLAKDLKFLNIRTNNNFGPSISDDPRYVAAEKANYASEKEKAAKLKEIQNELKAEYKTKTKLRMLITGVTIRGPLNQKPSPVQTQLFGELKRDDPFTACRPILQELANQLFRRPVSEEQLQPYVAMAQAEYDATGNTYGAVKVAINAMLCSPYFVLKYEGNQPELDDYMIASRLSYFLWNSTPDEELLKLAAEGKLKDPAVRTEQALRLLNGREKSARFTRDFTHQWLGMEKFGQFAPNEAYLEANRYADLQPHIAQEPQQFFNEILYSNLSALNFIDSDFVIWNRYLYSIYATKEMKIDYDRNVDQEIFQKMELSENPDRIRGGLPSMGAIMSLTTDGENTQPILRGVWVARRMLGTEIEAPATVPAIEINLENVSRPRDVLAKHKEDRSCYVCHVKFDYIGLALENYDVLGRYKTEYVHPVINEKGRPELVTKDPIDSLSETPAGEAMPGVAGLKSHLMDNKETVMRNLTEKLFGYALGREVRYKDREQILALLADASANDYKLKDLVLTLVASDSFVHR
jgi:hypothetical protein